MATRVLAKDIESLLEGRVLRLERVGSRGYALFNKYDRSINPKPVFTANNLTDIRLAIRRLLGI